MFTEVAQVPGVAWVLPLSGTSAFHGHGQKTKQKKEQKTNKQQQK